MADPISVLVRRGATVEAVHRVHAVAVQDGTVVEACGDPGLVCFLRSAAKPFQALPLARAREDLDERDLDKLTDVFTPTDEVSGSSSSD